MAKVIMVQGTMSNAGKSLIVAGLCRIFAQDGYRVAPFKSQNMALNSYITEDGLEMGRAQVMQAEAAGVKPSVLMNPILLKPTNDVGSQVIVKGEVLGNMRARDYFAYKKKLVPTICEAFSELEKQADIIVMEGAGSPAEINLKSDDIVNMRRHFQHRRFRRFSAFAHRYSLPVPEIAQLPAFLQNPEICRPQYSQRCGEHDSPDRLVDHGY